MSALICLLACLCAERVDRNVVVTLPPLNHGEQYTLSWIEPKPLSDPIWLSQNSLQFESDDTGGSIYLVHEGDEIYRIVKFDWASPPTMSPWKWFVGGVVLFLSILVAGWLVSKILSYFISRKGD